MSEIPAENRAFVVEHGSSLPERGNFKYIHVPAGTHFGVNNPETIILGDIAEEHRDIARDYFGSLGANISSTDAQTLAYVNAGIIKSTDHGYFLVGRSGGLKSASPTGAGTDMMKLTEEEKEKLDEKTLNYLKNLYPDKNFRAI